MAKNFRYHIFRWGLVITLIPLFSSVIAQVLVGKFKPQSLPVSADARQVGMGEAFTALAYDRNVMRYNVGGLGSLRHITLSTHFMKWLDGTQQGAMEMALPWRFGVVGFNLTYLDEGNITELDENFQPTGRIFESNDLILSFGYGGYLRLFNNTFSFGAGLKFIRQNLAGESATGTGIDIGLLYAQNHLSFGATLQNLTISKFKFIEGSYLLPETIRSGVAVRLPIGSRFKWNIATDVVKMLGNSDEELRVYSGTELWIVEIFAVRGGYKFHDTELTRWGVGFGVMIPMNWLGRSSIELDYAYSPIAAFDTQAHLFSLSFTFGAVQRNKGR
ncbi:MAG: PorV/PorQ family protein [Anaerolineae bacterium]|nr:PorV/PorQ family protein [Anaerolineae bacterium]